MPHLKTKYEVGTEKVDENEDYGGRYQPLWGGWSGNPFMARYGYPYGYSPAYYPMPRRRWRGRPYRPRYYM